MLVSLFVKEKLYIGEASTLFLRCFWFYKLTNLDSLSCRNNMWHHIRSLRGRVVGPGDMGKCGPDHTGGLTDCARGAVFRCWCRIAKGMSHVAIIPLHGSNCASLRGCLEIYGTSLEVCLDPFDPCHDLGLAHHIAVHLVDDRATDMA